MDKLIIYQALVRLFGNKNSSCKRHGTLDENGVGKMNDFTDKALFAIQQMGFNYIWYTGIIAHARCYGNPDFGIEAQHSSIVKGLAGSPYAITDYYDVDPDISVHVNRRVREFEELVDRTHNNKLKVIIDFVPNHVARQYKSKMQPDTSFGINDDPTKAFSATNDFYYITNSALQLPTNSGTLNLLGEDIDYEEFPAKVTGNDQFSAQVSINDWYETIKLNYGVDYLNNGKKYFEPEPPLWNKMVDILIYWAKKGVDGFRCDMAEMVPVEFWNFAINKIKDQFPSIIFIAEVYNPTQYQSYINIGKFDYLYDKVGLYDSLRSIITHGVNTNIITRSWQSVNGISQHMLSFLENHDEQRIASPFFAGNPFLAIPAMAIAATINQGPVMLYFGQELGEPATGESGYSGNDGRTTIFDYYNVPEHQKWVHNGAFNEVELNHCQIDLRQWYIALLNFIKTNRAITEGRFFDLLYTHPFIQAQSPEELFSFFRYIDDDIVLVVVNFAKSKSQQFVLKVDVNAAQTIGLTKHDVYTFEGQIGDNRKFTVPVIDIINRGIWFNMPPLSAKIFKIVPK